MKAVVEQYPNWETVLAPRIILGIWHVSPLLTSFSTLEAKTDPQPKFIEPASTILPFLPRYAISMSIPEVRKHFFAHCHGFSMRYEYLASAEGDKFRKECAAAGKGLCCWTVNGREEMRNCARWGIKSVISDKPEVWREIKREVSRVLFHTSSSCRG
jgi:phosphatidylglycerol phospholipase C